MPYLPFPRHISDTVGRLVSGFPHGAFWRVGAIVFLSKITRPEGHRRRHRGCGFRMTVANLVGIPVGNLSLKREFSHAANLFIDRITRRALTAISSGAGYSRQSPRACASSSTSCVARAAVSFRRYYDVQYAGVLPGFSYIAYL
ncbi:hypothetical protein KCP77_20210 [Salmonella enterica subsp. enterica]|nr:hypothetical protein KCP77_20210 [Salmonella enterica subsp. enterica]